MTTMTNYQLQNHYKGGFLQQLLIFGGLMIQIITILHQRILRLPMVSMFLLNQSNRLSLLRLCFTDELVDMIVTQTNSYTEQFIASLDLRSRSRVTKLTIITKDDILLYFRNILYHESFGSQHIDITIPRTPYLVPRCYVRF